MRIAVIPRVRLRGVCPGAGRVGRSGRAGVDGREVASGIHGVVEDADDLDRESNGVGSIDQDMPDLVWSQRAQAGADIAEVAGAQGERAVL